MNNVHKNWLIFNVIHLFLLFLTTINAIAKTQEVLVLESPNKQLKLTFILETGGYIRYAVAFKNQEIIKPSILGLVLSNNISLNNNLKLIASTESEINDWTILTFNEKKQVKNHCRQLIVELVKFNEPNYKINLIFRAYDEGVAFRYWIPQGIGHFAITDESTEFSFFDNLSIYSESGSQADYNKLNINQLSRTELTTTLTDNKLYLFVNEADNQSYARPVLSRNRQNTLKTARVFANANAPFQSPWRYVLIAESAIELIEKKFMLFNLAEPNKIGNLDWIKPGKAIREMTLTTAGAKNCIDFAQKMNWQYILFDAGWYGLGYTERQ